MPLSVYVCFEARDRAALLSKLTEFAASGIPGQIGWVVFGGAPSDLLFATQFSKLCDAWAAGRAAPLPPVLIRRAVYVWLGRMAVLDVYGPAPRANGPYLGVRTSAEDITVITGLVGDGSSRKGIAIPLCWDGGVFSEVFPEQRDRDDFLPVVLDDILQAVNPASGDSWLEIALDVGAETLHLWRDPGVIAFELREPLFGAETWHRCLACGKWDGSISDADDCSCGATSKRCWMPGELSGGASLWPTCVEGQSEAVHAWVSNKVKSLARRGPPGFALPPELSFPPRENWRERESDYLLPHPRRLFLEWFRSHAVMPPKGGYVWRTRVEGLEATEWNRRTILWRGDQSGESLDHGRPTVLVIHAHQHDPSPGRLRQATEFLEALSTDYGWVGSLIDSHGNSGDELVNALAKLATTATRPPIHVIDTCGSETPRSRLAAIVVLCDNATNFTPARIRSALCNGPVTTLGSVPILVVANLPRELSEKLATEVRRVWSDLRSNCA